MNAKSWNLLTKVLRNRQCLAAMSFPSPKPVHAAIALQSRPGGRWSRPLREEKSDRGTNLVARSKSPGFRQVQNQLEDQRRGRSIKLRILFQSFHPFASAAVQQAERLIHAQVNRECWWDRCASPSRKAASARAGSFFRWSRANPVLALSDREVRALTCEPPTIRSGRNPSSRGRNKTFPADSGRSHPRDALARRRAARRTLPQCWEKYKR